MKRTLLFLACLLASLTMSAQEGLVTGDVQNSGCLSNTRGEESKPLPKIILTKEGSVLSVQLLNYESNCATSDFNVTSKVNSGSDGAPFSVNINVVPYISGDFANCVCPFNVSFTVRDVEANSFYLSCWWYKGMIKLTEGEPMVLSVNKTIINEQNFPDSNFRNYLLSKEYGADGILTNEELENVDSLNISRLDIHNLRGIEYFTALKILNCMTNKVTTLDLSKNTSLEKLECAGNRMTTINLLENKELRYLSCVGNNLSALDISECTKLDTLACSGNQLTALNVSKNTKLRCLECYSNQLTALDLSKNTELRRLHCNNNQLTTLDISKNTALTVLVCSQNQLTTLDVTGNSSLRFLTCMDNQLATLYMSGNKSLEEVSCFNNQLTSLDVSDCSALTLLGCNDNQLTSLILSGCSALNYLNCGNNQLTTLDLSDNTALTTLYCYHNQIKGTGMDALVESLPTVSEGSLNVIYFEKEQNVMTTTQVAAAKAKGWTPYLCAYSISKEYVGIEMTQPAYRPFVEEGKVWKVGAEGSGNPVQIIDYYYFEGDTIIGGKTCKQMRRLQCNPDIAYIMQYPLLGEYIGAWYEEDKKVYEYDTKSKQFKMMYDFSIDANDTLQIDNFPYVIGPRKSGGIKGFKGVYREVWECGDGGNTFRCAPWLEGVGGIYGPPTINVFNVELGDPMWFLMSCTVGDEVIYLNDEYEDGATPEGARKNRFDFTHTIKVQPKARTRQESEQSLYGEYNEQQLGINLDPLNDVYQVRITDETGKAVYEKSINAANIVALNIDISAYAKGRYTVTVENSQETFTGEFLAQTTGIGAVRNKKEEVRDGIYNLQGQRLSSLRKGLNIVNGQKVYVKGMR